MAVVTVSSVTPSVPIVPAKMVMMLVEALTMRMAWLPNSAMNMSPRVFSQILVGPFSPAEVAATLFVVPEVPLVPATVVMMPPSILRMAWLPVSATYTLPAVSA